LTDNRLKVAIFGAGSIGCYLGGQLAHAGCEVVFIGRDKFKTALETYGLTLTHYERDDIHISKSDITFSLNPRDIQKADIILVTVKSQDSSEAARIIAQQARPDAVIISFQNGVSNVETLSGGLSQTILGGVVPFNVTGVGPGKFHSGTEGDLIVQELDDPRMERLKTAFEQSGQVLKFVPDVRAVQWGKLLVNLNNALSALSGGTLREGLAQKAYRRVLANMIEEGLSVAKGAEIAVSTFGKASPEQTIKILRFPTWLFNIVMNRVIRIDKAARSSMLDDLEMGRSSEIDFLQGEIVGLAQKTDQSAPINDRILKAVLNAFDMGESPKLTGAQIEDLIHK